MAPIQQDQQLNKSKKQGQKKLFPLLLRHIIPIIVSLAIGVIAILWILSTIFWKNAISTIFTIIFTALGLIFAFFQVWHPSKSSYPSPASPSSTEPLQHDRDSASIPDSELSSAQMTLSSPVDTSSPTSTNPFFPLLSTSASSSNSPDQTKDEEQCSDIPKEDWDNVPNVQAFYGREKELGKLRGWVLHDRCQLVIVTGGGGIGKTMLTAKLAEDVAREFDYVFWRSLQDAPPFESILERCLLLLSHQQPLDRHLNADELISLLLSNMKTHRCLLILDNLESILQVPALAGEYRDGYEDYGRLIDAIGRTRHQSCLLVTTRELPKEITPLVGKTGSVRPYTLKGLKVSDGLKILEDKELDWSKQAKDAEELVLGYAGNPLALRVAADFIQTVFVGDIASFLTNSNLVFRDIQRVLEEQFERLSPLEQQIMYWLAIEREAISFKNLQNDFASPPEVMTLTNALESLLRRSLIEVSQNGYTLQPVILEFMTEKLVARVVEEIERGYIKIIENYALLKAQAKDYVRDTQRRLILALIAQQLLTLYGRERCEVKLTLLLRKLHKAKYSKRGYAAGNLLNLLIHLGYDLTGYDFSHLYIRQVYLQGVLLNHVNFAHSHMENAVFTENFTSILSVAFSSDGRLLVAGTENGDVRLWDASNGAPLRNYQGHAGRVRSVAFSPDGRTIVSGSEDYTLHIWSIYTDQAVHVLKAHTDRVRAVAFSPDGTRVLSASDDGTVRIWDMETSLCVRVLEGHTDRVRTVAISPDGRTIASGAEDQTICLWDVQSGACLKVLEGHERQIHAVNFSPDSKWLVSGGEDQTVRLWDVQSGTCLMILHGHTNQVRSVIFDPIGNLVASSSDDQTIRIWDIKSSQSIKTLEGHLHRIYSVTFSPGGATIISGSEDQTIRVWDVHSGQCLKTLQGYINQVRSATFHPAGTFLISGGDDQQLRLWSVQSLQCIKTLQGHSNGVRWVAFSLDGERIASCSDDRTVRLWNAHSGKCLKVFREHTDRVRTVTFTHNGTRLASGGEDYTVRIWDTRSGQRLKVLQGHTDWVRSVAFSPDDTILVSGSEDYTVRVWDMESYECFHILGGHKNGVRCVAFSPDGNILASSGDDETIRLWDTTTWHHFNILQGTDDTRLHWIIAIAFSPDGILLASGGEDQVVRLWDVKSGKCLRTMLGHEHRVYSVAFHPDGHMLASGSLDGTIRFWDVDTGTCLHILRNNKPYEGMNITDTEGLTETQYSILRALGAVEDEKGNSI